MPIYEYKCGDCGHTLDALQKLADDPLKDCPECRQPALRRLISAPAFRLKGGGWYETDFKSDKEKKRNLADGAGGKGSDDKPGGDKSGGDKSKGDKTKSSDSPKTESPKAEGARSKSSAKESGGTQSAA